MAVLTTFKCDVCSKKAQVGRDKLGDWIKTTVAPFDDCGRTDGTMTIELLTCSPECLKKKIKQGLD